MVVSVNKRQQCPIAHAQNLTNYASKKEVTDVLLMKSTEDGVCSGTTCNGSLMNIRRMPLSIRPPNEMLVQATKLMEEYHKHIKRLDSDDFKIRMEEISRSITRTGTYELTYDELLFGAKLAWRNAPRCIGRISWNTLHLIDGRHVKTAKEMYDLFLEHLKYATNGGNLRSTITVYPQRKPGQRDFLVWNPQLIAYAGYEQPDGSFIGDPNWSEFTKVCQNLGWKGKGGRFDVLPLVVSTPTSDPEWFEIPEELILTVKLRHPEYKWLEELNLEWFALPGVSSLMLDCGGIQFTAAPFNGWYMSTEIGTRDLCDEHRYNIAPEIAEKMGLDTRSPATLWKDKVTLELNVAVLHSFKESGVTLVDHHTAAETFMQFHENEYRERGGCPADWIWIVPPISGSLTPVFHQEMSLYYLKPNYEYQIAPWIAFEKQNKMLIEGKNADSERPIKVFRKVALAAVFACTLYTSALAKRSRVTIIYGTQTGKAQMYANSLNKMFSGNFNSQVVNMADYDMNKLNNETMVLFLASTTGYGEPPESTKEFATNLYNLTRKNNADDTEQMVNFWEDYNSYKVNGDSITSSEEMDDDKSLSLHKNRGFFSRLAQKLRKRRFDESDENLPSHYMSAPDLNHLQDYKSFDTLFAVFALGSTNYKHFCVFGKYINHLMYTLGGERILDIAFGDENENQQGAFNSWSLQLLEACCERVQIKPLALNVTNDEAITVNDIKIISQTSPQPLAKALSHLHENDIRTARIANTKTLFQDQDKWFQHIEISTSDNNNSNYLIYKPGDHVGVIPSNDPVLVQGILNRLINCPDADTPVKILMRQNKGMDSWVQHPKLPVASIRTLLSRFLDINSPPSQKLLEILADQSNNNNHMSRLKMMSQINEEYQKWRQAGRPNILKTMQDFSVPKIDARIFLHSLNFLQPRMYSIGSSPKAQRDLFSLTIANFSYRSQDEIKQVHQGVCTSYLKKLHPGDTLEIFHRSAPQFHLPDERSMAPIILIGVGCGVAPLRSFWQHFYHRKNKNNKGSLPEISLFYGCHTHASNLYAEEKDAMVRAKVFAHMHLALSREQKAPKTYVQDLLLVHGKHVYKQLMLKGGYLYLCGSEGVADGVHQSLLFIFQEHGKVTLDKAQKMINKMKEQNRYRLDVFGNGSPR